MWTVGSLFSGIGGLELGLEASGFGPTMFQVEADPFCREVLESRWPDVPKFDDVRTVGAHNLPRVSCLVGGFPCQDISSAGTGAGLAGSRSGLWFEFARLVLELRPEWVVVENVSSGAKRWVDDVCVALEQYGYEALPLPIAAKDVGAPHIRRRIFIVAWNPRNAMRTGCEGVTGQVDFEGRAEFGARAVHASDPECREVRDGQQRLPARWEGGVRDQGQAESLYLSVPRHAADAGLERLEEWARQWGYFGQEQSPAPRSDSATDARCWGQQSCGQSTEGGLEGSTGGELDGRGGAWPDCARGTAWGPLGQWSSEPPVRGVDDGPTTELDRSRLRALGNAVVPQTAEVVGYVIQELAQRRATMAAKKTKTAPARKKKAPARKKKATSKKPARKPVEVDETEVPETEAPETETEESEPEEDVLTVVELEMRDSIYDLLAREAQRRQMSPAECAMMLVEAGLTAPLGVTTVAAGNLSDEDDERDPENDALLEDPDFQEAFQNSGTAA